MGKWDYACNILVLCFIKFSDVWTVGIVGNNFTIDRGFVWIHFVAD